MVNGKSPYDRAFFPDDWVTQGLCRNHPRADHIWFPTRERDADEGVQICRQCPVKTECLITALQYQQEWGTWGSVTEWERARLKIVPRKHRRPGSWRRKTA